MFSDGIVVLCTRSALGELGVSAGNEVVRPTRFEPVVDEREDHAADVVPTVLLAGGLDLLFDPGIALLVVCPVDDVGDHMVAVAE
jgi:hypothetical protein